MQGQLDEAKAEVVRLRDETERLRARAEGADAEAEREQVRGRRGTAQAEAERDAMATTMALRMQSADAALAEAAAAEARVETERAAMARHSAEQLERHAAQKESLELQLAEAKEAAVALQDMLATQQQLAEEYREQARRNLLQLKQARLPHTMGMGADAPGAAAGDGEGDVGGDIYAQLQAAREREQQGRRMLQAAALVVS